MSERLIATYRLRTTAADIDAQAAAIAVEQSVEMPVSAISDDWVLTNSVGQVEAIRDHGDGTFLVQISLLSDTTGAEPGQVMNMLFGNSSIHDHVTLEDAEFPATLASAFPGPAFGEDGLRHLVGASNRAMTGSALKPQGLAPAALADLGYRLALGRLDFIKDDHGLADQRFSPFEARVASVAAAIARANAETGHSTRYIPSLTGNLDQMRHQARFALDHGVVCAMMAPMIAGIPALTALRRDFPQLAIFAHPALAGACRMAPPLLLGKLFRLFGADATIFPNYGGRFGYSADACGSLARAALTPWHGFASTLPVPAGGMSAGRADEMLNFYGPHVMLLIGGALLAAGKNLTQETQVFTQKVSDHVFR